MKIFGIMISMNGMVKGVDDLKVLMSLISRYDCDIKEGTVMEFLNVIFDIMAWSEKVRGVKSFWNMNFKILL